MSILMSDGSYMMTTYLAKFEICVFYLCFSPWSEVDKAQLEKGDGDSEH